LKENFDRFNFALYKEKQMADFRRWFTVLAVLAVVAFTASAQVGVATGSATSTLACTATSAGTPELRPEGYTELVGDIIITCTGGQVLNQGASIPTTNITVYTFPQVPITSRYISSNGASEALLIVDEAGSSLTTGATGGFGPKAPQTLCTSSQQAALPSPCSAVVGVDNSGLYEVAVTSTGTAAPNVFQGRIGDYGANTVSFYNVPVLPPASAGVTRVFRITNIRVPAVGQAQSTQIQAIISTSPNQTLPLNFSQQVQIGIVGTPMSAAVKPVKKAFQQCVPASVALSANLIYTEGFATGFKTRVVPGGTVNGTPGAAGPNSLYNAEATNTGSPYYQNVPGGLYGGFSANTESGFIFPALATSNTGTAAVNYTAGLADYGTRLKAVFYNIPAGLTLYVSTSSAAQTAAGFIAGGTSSLPYAVLVATNSGETTPDGTAFAPIAATSTGSDGLGAIALSANASGAATAIWEVTNSNQNAQDVLTFSVYIGYTASSATTANPYGLPITDLPLSAPLNDVQMSFAPEPSLGIFSITNSSQGQTPTPRFAVVKTYEGRWTTIGLCQTTLLYPFVTGAAGFDTGIAVANTSMDPWSTVNQVGSCTLYGYGVTVASAGNTAIQTKVPGCDAISNPLPGTNCFAVVPSGQVMSVMASSVLTNFQGYVIAVCNFQYAHGYAAVTDLGLRNLWSSYLALEIAPLPTGSTAGTVVGSPRTGAASIEELVH
jgi:hypothetical protein